MHFGVLLFPFFVYQCYARDSVFPDMFGGEVTHFQPPEKIDNNDSPLECPKCPIPEERVSLTEIYFKRFLNQLLARTDLKNFHVHSTDYVTVPMMLSFSGKALSIIKSFASNKPHEFTWVDLDEALFSMFEESRAAAEAQFERKSMPVETEFIEGGSTYFTPELVIISVVSTIVFVAFWYILKGLSILHTIFLVFIVAFSFGLGWTWWRELELERVAALTKILELKGVPDVCNPSKQTWWERNYSLKGECKELHWAHVNPMAKVVFTEVFSKTVTNMFLTPLPILGDAVGGMLAKYSGHLPFGFNYVFWLIQLLVTPIFALMIIIFIGLGLFGISFELKLPLVSFLLGKKNDGQSSRERLTGRSNLKIKQEDVQTKRKPVKQVPLPVKEKKPSPAKEIQEKTHITKKKKHASSELTDNISDTESPSEKKPFESAKSFDPKKIPPPSKKPVMLEDDDDDDDDDELLTMGESAFSMLDSDLEAGESDDEIADFLPRQKKKLPYIIKPVSSKLTTMRKVDTEDSYLRDWNPPKTSPLDDEVADIVSRRFLEYHPKNITSKPTLKNRTLAEVTSQQRYEAYKNSMRYHPKNITVEQKTIKSPKTELKNKSYSRSSEEKIFRNIRNSFDLWKNV